MNQTFQVDHFRPLNAGHKDLFEFNGIAKVLQKNSFEEVLYFVQVIVSQLLYQALSVAAQIASKIVFSVWK